MGISGRLKLVAAGTLAVLLAACQSGPSALNGTTAATTACPTLKPGSGPYVPPFPVECDLVQMSASGLQWLEITAGPDGKGSPSDGATVIVAYEGFLADTGQRFDSSYARGEPAVFNVDEVIKGWTETLKRMTPGDEWLVYIPADLGYGSRASGTDIPPNSDLVFRIRLDGFLNPDELAGGAPQASRVPEELWTQFIPWNSNRDGVVRLNSGLSYFELEQGPAGSRKVLGQDMVVIDYEARLADSGKVFGSTFSSESPLTVRAGDMVPGVAQMISLMQPGDVWIARIPAAIGYGRQGLGDAVPPGADLIYLVDLIAVNPE